VDQQVVLVDLAFDFRTQSVREVSAVDTGRIRRDSQLVTGAGSHFSTFPKLSLGNLPAHNKIAMQNTQLRIAHQYLLSQAEITRSITPGYDGSTTIT
jgi:hypothetical protein